MNTCDVESFIGSETFGSTSDTDEVSLDDSNDIHNRYEVTCKVFNATVRWMSENMGGVAVRPLLEGCVSNNNIGALMPAAGEPAIVCIYLAFVMRNTSGLFSDSKCIPYDAHMFAVKNNTDHVCFSMIHSENHAVSNCPFEYANLHTVLLVKGEEACISFMEAHYRLTQTHELIGWNDWIVQKIFCIRPSSPAVVQSQFEYIACVLNEFLVAKDKLNTRECTNVVDLYYSILKIKMHDTTLDLLL